ncbi:UNVERIFIED_CONTAM: hypothetical protein RMT77_007015 [Armadillidium vulgare]
METLKFVCFVTYMFSAASGLQNVNAQLKNERIVSTYEEDGDIYAQEGIANNWISKARFFDSIFEDGWSYLEVETSSAYPDSIQSYAAGFSEGYIASPLIYNSWRNTQEGFCEWKGQEYCENLREFLNKNIDWMNFEIREKRFTSPIWHHVELILSQLKGISDGYNNASDHKISLEDLLLMNMSGDLEDLDNVLNPEKQNLTFDEWLNNKDSFSDGHCSALIKVLPNNEDLYVSHVTWNSFQSMLRVQKKYIFPFGFTSISKSSAIVPGHTATFSSYPAYLHSGDDFYTLSSGLCTLETTIGNSDPALWKNVKPVGELQEWIRVIAANRLATSGRTWTAIFKQYNSGTYNNQWMIVDYKLFKPGKPLRPETLYVLEQLPGYVLYADKTDTLLNQSYWPSYNIPSFPKIFALSGGPALVAKYGDWFSYEKSPRALIFARNSTLIHDMDSMIGVMRYNNFKYDPYSRCNCTPPYSAENGISARSDLNPKNGTYPFSALGHRSHGGTDMKVTNSQMFFKFRFKAVSSPTYDQQPVFIWSKQDFANDTPHYGHPDIWNFPIIEHKWIW